MADALEVGSETPVCLPKGAHYCDVLNRASANGVSVDLRKYGWNHATDGTFATDHFFIDYAMAPRPKDAVMFDERGRGTFKPGTMVFMPAGAHFRTHCERSDHLSFCLSYGSDRLNGILERVDECAGLLEPCLDLRQISIDRYIRRALDELTAPGFATDVVIELVADSIMVEILRRLACDRDDSGPAGGSMAPWRLKWLKQRIAEGLGQPISVSALARECGISTRHLVRTFRNSEGTTLSEYITRARIARARELLTDGDRLIKVIAHDCGFASASSFSVAFQNATGETPRQFREAHRALLVSYQPGSPVQRKPRS